MAISTNSQELAPTQSSNSAASVSQDRAKVAGSDLDTQTPPPYQGFDASEVASRPGELVQPPVGTATATPEDHEVANKDMANSNKAKEEIEKVLEKYNLKGVGIIVIDAPPGKTRKDSCVLALRLKDDFSELPQVVQKRHEKKLLQSALDGLTTHVNNIPATTPDA